MELKVQCPCGQAYEFDVEPVNGRMPFPINCPTCGADGTELSNAVLAQTFPQAPQPEPVAEAAPAGGLRINRPAQAPAPVEQTTAPADLPSAPAAKPWLNPAPRPDAPRESTENIPLGILGGVLAGSLAMAGWYFLTVSSGKEFGMVAWFAGIVTGFGVLILGRDGTPLLGAIASICAAVAILGGEFLVVNHFANRALNRAAESVYLSRVAYAGKVVAAKTDAQLKEVLAEKREKGPDQVTAEELATFREKDLPKLQDLANGKPSEKEFVNQFQGEKGSFSFKFKLFEKFISLFTILWVCFGVASAYRIGSG
jgi:hypothetical protein